MAAKHGVAPEASQSADNGWYVVWCHQDAYKINMADTAHMLAEEVSLAGGYLVRKRNARMFQAMWLNQDVSDEPYVLILSWRDTKPCLASLDEQLLRGHSSKMPQHIYVVVDTETVLRRASSWAATQNRQNLTLVPQMTSTLLKASLSIFVSQRLGGRVQHLPKALPGRDPTKGKNGQESFQCSVVEPQRAGTGNSSKLAQQSTPSTPSQTLCSEAEGFSFDISPCSRQDRSSHLLLSYLVDAVKDPCMAASLNSLLLKHMPEAYTE